jgi:hypothetical protein
MGHGQIDVLNVRLTVIHGEMIKQKDGCNTHDAPTLMKLDKIDIEKLT